MLEKERYLERTIRVQVTNELVDVIKTLESRGYKMYFSSIMVGSFGEINLEKNRETLKKTLEIFEGMLLSGEY